MTQSRSVASPLLSVREPGVCSVKHALTPRAIACGTFLGSAVCFANMYFGLQAGTVNAMPMQSALLGFAIFRSSQHRLSRPLTPGETTCIETISGALGLAPFTSGFTSFIPALEFLVTPEEQGTKKFTLAQLLLWSVATCALGIVVAPPFRQLFILRERLRFPSATGTGTLIGVLFGTKAIVARAQQPEIPLRRPRSTGDNPEFGFHEDDREDEVDRAEIRLSDSFTGSVDIDVEYAVNVLLISLAGSSLFCLLSYFLPILRSVPIFGLSAAKDWLWAFDLSPAYFGYGIIIGPSVNAYMLLGAVIGWGILSPLAKYKGWVSGPVNDWNSGSRGLVMWVGMGLILGDSVVGLGWLIVKSLLAPAQRKPKSPLPQEHRSREVAEQESLLRDGLVVCREDDATNSALDDDWPSVSTITTRLSVWTGAILFPLYFAGVLGFFWNSVTVPGTLVAVLFMPVTAFIAMRSLGETDSVAALAIGRVAQFVISIIVPASSGNHISANLLLAGAVESGSSQAASQMGCLKTAYITKTAPRAIFFGQIFGSFIGAGIATFIYRTYTEVKEIPSQEFAIPDAHMWLVAARFFYQQRLPHRVMSFAIVALLLGAILSTLRILGTNRWWKDFVPSGIAMAIGMYVVPAIALPRALGSLIFVVGRDRYGIKSIMFLCSATGLILGQGLFSLVALVFDAVHVPRF